MQTHGLSKILLTIIIKFLVSVSAQDENLTPCHVPNGVASYCVPYSKCRHVSKLIENLQKPLPGDVSLLIRDSFFCTEKSSSGDVQVCCPLEGIEPTPPEAPPVEDLGSCSLQGGGNASCVLYDKCSPFLQMLTNMRQPFPPEIPELMRNSWLCDVQNIGGFLLPAICCPNEAVELLSPRSKFDSHPNRKALAPSDSCGMSQGLIFTRIVGGKTAELGAYPWLANLGYQSSPNSEVQFKCGGSLIGSRYVITAAHCVTGLPGTFKLTTIRVGEYQLSNSPDCTLDGSRCAPPAQDYGVAKVIFHPQYNIPNAFRNDIALVQLNDTVEENEFVTPICLPFEDESDDTYQFSDSGLVERIHVAGWGATDERGRDPADILQYLNVTVFEGDKCKEVYEERQGFINPEKQLCAGGEKGKDSCVGDSGSALMMEQTSDTGKPFWKQIGVVSFGPRLCGTEGIPGVYTKIRSYLDWILDNVEL